MTDIIITLGLAALAIFGITYYLRKYNKSLEGNASKEIKTGRDRQLQSREKADKFFRGIKLKDYHEVSDSEILKELKRRMDAK